MNIKNKTLIKIGLMIILLAIILAKPIFNIVENQEKLTKRELEEYKSLIRNEVQSKLLFFNTIESKTREPESQYIYDNNYNIFITKLHISDLFDLRKSISVKTGDFVFDNNNVRFPIMSFNSKIDIESVDIPLIKSISLKVAGEDVNIIDSLDSQKYVYFHFKKSSLVFNNDKNYITLETTNGNNPAAICFVQKKNILYIILMTAAKGNVEFGANQLINIINSHR